MAGNNIKLAKILTVSFNQDNVIFCLSKPHRAIFALELRAASEYIPLIHSLKFPTQKNTQKSRNFLSLEEFHRLRSYTRLKF